MNYHLQIVLLMLGIVCGFAQTNIDWKLGMKPEQQKATVKAGTNVVFKWNGSHDVYLFTNKNAYDTCDFSKGKATMLAKNSDNPYTYTAKTAGTFYFGCSIGSGGHCKTPQKLTLTVTGMFCVCCGYVVA